MVYKDKRIWAERKDRYKWNKYGPAGSPEVHEGIAASRRRMKASLETRMKMSAAHKGHPTSTETREKQRQSNLKAWSNTELLTRHRAQRALQAPPRVPWNHTKPENILAQFLTKAGYSFIREKVFFPYRVDFYVPDYHLAFEADGTFWHRVTEQRRPDYYAKRDRKLLEHYGLPVVRLTDKEINSWEGQIY